MRSVSRARRCILLCTNRAPPGARRLPRIVTIVSAPVANSTSSSAAGHRPVLLAEAVAALQPRPGGRYLDGTFGGGGHTRALLESSAPDGIVLALDADPAAMDRASALRQDPVVAERLIPVHANFADLAVKVS